MTNFGYGKLCKYNLENNESDIVDLPVEIAPSSVLVDGSRLWVTDDNDAIYIFKNNTYELECKLELKPSKKKCPWPFKFSASEIMGDYIYLSPVNYEKIIRVNRHNYEIETVYEIEEDAVCWSICVLDNDNLYFDVYNYQTGEAGNITVSSNGKLTINDRRFRISNMYFPNDINESRANSLTGFLDYVRRNRYETEL